MKAYPILYKLNELVQGNGFFAGIELYGRALVVEEEPGEWWAYGVKPGAITGHGATIVEAFADLQRNFRRYLADQADEAPSFEALRSELQRFFNECDEETLADWDTAVAAMKAGTPAPAGISKQDSDSAHCGIKVVELGPARSRIEVDDGLKVAV